MGFTVQSDAGGVVGANAYLSVAEFKTYHSDRGTTVTQFTDPQIETMIVKGTDHVDGRFKYVGRKRTPDQTTQWPRSDAKDADGDSVSTIPQAVKEACAEYALRAGTITLMPDPDRDASGRLIQSKSEKVGPIEESTVFVQGAGSYQMPDYPAADQKLRRAGLVQTSGIVRRG